MRRKAKHRLRKKGSVMFQLADGTTFRIGRITIVKFPRPTPKSPWKLDHARLSKARRRKW